MTQTDRPGWWPLALAEEVTAKRPLGVQCGPILVALFRDQSGAVRAVEDRCPHRRAPLSVGRITPDGQLQCGYHGWTFSGTSGRLTAIPNLDPGERLINCTIGAFAAAERAGLVYIWTGDPADADPDHIPAVPYTAASREFTGTTILPLGHTEFVATLLDGPGHVITYTGAAFDVKAVGDARLQQGLLHSDRAASWNWLAMARLNVGPLDHRADYPLLFRTQTVPVTGLMAAQLCSNDGRELVRTVIASAPCARNTTAVRWRASVVGEAPGAGARAIALLAGAGLSPFRINTRLDGRAIAEQVAGPAEVWRELSQPNRVQPNVAGLLATA